MHGESRQLTLLRTQITNVYDINHESRWRNLCHGLSWFLSTLSHSWCNVIWALVVLFRLSCGLIDWLTDEPCCLSLPGCGAVVRGWSSRTQKSRHWSDESRCFRPLLQDHRSAIVVILLVFIHIHILVGFGFSYLYTKITAYLFDLLYFMLNILL